MNLHLVESAATSSPVIPVSEPSPTPVRKRLLRLPQVKDATGLSRTTIYRKIASREFPGPIRISQRAIAWIEDYIMGWIVAQEKLSRDGEDAR
jgi:prophage regulatory protein